MYHHPKARNKDYKLDLASYLSTFPRNQRMSVKQQLAEAHGVSEVTIRAWANGTRNHPYTLSSIEITEKITGNKVTRFDLRPDVYSKER